MHKGFSARINHLKALGACCIFVFHYYHFVLHPFFEPLDTMNPVILLIYHGYWPVYLFFMLSGFLLARSYFAEPVALYPFVIKRLFRLLPTYFLCLLTYYVFLYKPGHLNNGFSTWSFFDIQTYPQPINHLWFVNRILFCYLIFPVLCFIHRRAGAAGLIVCLAISILVSVMHGIVYEVTQANYYGSLLLCLNYFTGGCLITKWRLKQVSGRRLTEILVFIGIGFALLAFYHQSVWNNPLGFSLVGLFWLNALGVFIAVFITGYINVNSITNNWFGRSLDYFGRISYSFYLFHFLVIYYFLAHPLFFTSDPSINFILLFIICVALALTSYLTVERWTRNLSMRIISLS